MRRACYLVWGSLDSRRTARSGLFYLSLCLGVVPVPRTSVAGRVEFWAEATQASSEMRSLCERRCRGRHVTRSSCRPAAILPFSLRTVQRTNCRFNFASQLVFKENFDDEPHSPMAVSLLQVGPSRACPRTHVPHLRSRSATCSRPFAVQFMDCWT